MIIGGIFTHHQATNRIAEHKVNVNKMILIAMPEDANVNNANTQARQPHFVLM